MPNPTIKRPPRKLPMLLLKAWSMAPAIMITLPIKMGHRRPNRSAIGAEMGVDKAMSPPRKIHFAERIVPNGYSA
jgi:hypothetical protein